MGVISTNLAIVNGGPTFPSFKDWVYKTADPAASGCRAVAKHQVLSRSTLRRSSKNWRF